MTPSVERAELLPPPPELVARRGAPETADGWKVLADGLLTTQCCAFHRNIEISSRYAWIYTALPSCFKWAGMAALASHHVRLALIPLRVDTDHTGYVDLTRNLGRQRLLMQDVNTIRAINNGIFDDIFWVHLAYVTAGDDRLDRLRSLLGADDHYAPVLAGFEAIDRGRRILDDEIISVDARRAANDLIWTGNLVLLEHEQRALVQPHFDQLSAAFARFVSLGSATSFEVRGMRREVAYFTSFYAHSLTRGVPHVVRARAWPRITCFEDRWRWLTGSVVPRFQRLDAEPPLIDASLRRIFDEARQFAETPCLIPHHPEDDDARPAGPTSARPAWPRRWRPRPQRRRVSHRATPH